MKIQTTIYSDMNKFTLQAYQCSMSPSKFGQKKTFYQSMPLKRICPKIFYRLPDQSFSLNNHLLKFSKCGHFNLACKQFVNIIYNVISLLLLIQTKFGIVTGQRNCSSQRSRSSDSKPKNQRNCHRSGSSQTIF
jgi:hypothetical protein